MSLNDYSDRVAVWLARNFPGDNLLWRGLVLAEEVGEVCRCIVKADSGQRGTRDEWMRELYIEVGDVFLSLQATCNLAGIDLEKAVHDRFTAVEHMDLFARRLPSEKP